MCPTPQKRRDLTFDEYQQGVRAGDRAILGRAMSLIESNNPQHQKTADQLLTGLMANTGDACRVGITGVPGVGKSTFIEALGMMLTESGHRVAVLAVDPSSEVTGGSILGDKTRMAQLAVNENAFIRPSPTAGTLGGVASKTREIMLLCEAAGFDVILVETVGVGQSETVVAGMTDLFLTLMLPGAGDELQGIKRGLLELTDFIVVNKADGPNTNAAQQAVREYQHAMRYTRSSAEDHADQFPVLACSALENVGIDTVWKEVSDHWSAMRESGSLEGKRQSQMLNWMQSMISERLKRLFLDHERVQSIRDRIEGEVRVGTMPASVGAGLLLDAFTESEGQSP